MLSFARPKITRGPSPACIHNQEIFENKSFWEAKPLLRDVYADFYQSLASRFVNANGAESIELGSGMGNIKAFVPACVTTDIFENPWLDRVENAYALSCADASVANLVMFDVWHHLQYPANALAEANRVLTREGRLIIFDPAMSLIGRLVYGLFHHEPLNFDTGFSSSPVPLPDLDSLPYFAAQSSAHRVFVKGEFPELLEKWHMEEICHLTSFAYLGSGGFRGRQWYPSSTLPLVRRIDRWLSRWPRIFAARLLVVLSKR
jgi:hypothetical protein